MGIGPRRSAIASTKAAVNAVVTGSVLATEVAETTAKRGDRHGGLPQVVGQLSDPDDGPRREGRELWRPNRVGDGDPEGDREVALADRGGPWEQRLPSPGAQGRFARPRFD